MLGFRLAIVYVTDASYHDLTLYSLASVARSHQAPLDFHFMQSGYEATIDAAFVRHISSRGHRLFARRVAFEVPDKGSRTHAKTYTYITDAMFLKAAAIEALTEQYDYVLYMDGDMLAFGDLRLDALAGFSEMAAACLDITSAIDVGDQLRVEEFGGQSPRVTFNTGMIVVNAQAWRTHGAYARFLEALIQHQRECPYSKTCEPNDQCALNMALAGHWRPLDLMLNVQKVAMHTRAWSQAIVRHYTGRNKFLPLRVHRCDEREYCLLCSISSEAGLAHPGYFYDRGLSYFLNGVRRIRAVRKAERAIARIDTIMSAAKKDSVDHAA